MDIATMTTPVTRRHRFQGKQRPTLFVDATAGYGVSNTGVPFHCEPKLSASTLVDSVPADIAVIFLCADLPRSPQVRTEDDLRYSPFNSWVIEAAPETMFLDSGEEHADTTATIRRRDGREVNLRVVSCWTGDHRVTPDEAYKAMALVRDELRKLPNWEAADLLITPSMTGAELWHCMLGYDQKNGRAVEYPVLPQDLRDLIHRTSGQGRFEMLPCPNSSGMAPALFYLDDRLAYGARALTELGIGPATYDSGSHYEGYRPARYLVRFQVPEDWNHVGLLPVQRPIVRGAEAIGLDFPRTPGAIAESWVDASELRVAFAPFPVQCPICRELYSKNGGSACPQHGWRIDILERIIFTRGKPLAAWAQKLIQLRETVSPNETARAIVRNLILHTVGRLNGTHRPVTRTSIDCHSIPDHMPVHTLISPDGFVVYQWQEEGASRLYADYNRPEWSSQIWAKERARLLLGRYGDGTFTGALTLPFEGIVSFRLDAMYTTIDPHWPDDGQPGRMRRKGHLPGPTRWPREEEDLIKVKEQLQ